MKRISFRASAAVAALGLALTLAACGDPPVTTTTTTTEQTTTGPANMPPPALTPATPGTVTTQTTNAQTNP